MSESARSAGAGVGTGLASRTVLRRRKAATPQTGAVAPAGPPAPMIPDVHQALFTDPGVPAPTGYLAMAMGSVRDAFPTGRYRCWGLEEATELIADHFDRDVLRAFRCLRPYAYKADLFKYCVLHVHGGWYADAGTRVLQRPMELPFATSERPPRLVVFRGTGLWDAAWACSISFLYAARGHEVLPTAIDEVVDNCRQQRYGANPLSVTMTAFGRAIAIHNVREQIEVGLIVDVTGAPYERAHQLGEHGHVAARKPRLHAGDLAGIGVEGTNDYARMWEAREVYGPW